MKKHQKEYYIDNKEYQNEYKKEYRENISDEQKQKIKEYQNQYKKI